MISFEKLLKKIEWPHCAISFLLDKPDESFVSELKTYLGKTRFNSDELTGSLFIKSYPQHPQIINNLIHNLVSFTNFDCLGIYIQTGKPIDRIAMAIAGAVRLAEHLANSGISQPVSLQRISFAIETGTDLFIEIATLKALRLLWFQITRAYGLPDYQLADLLIHSISPAWVQDALGPHSNMLKGTTAAMAAIIGGCNALSVLPENESDQRQVRIARNVSNLLKEESRLDKVTDPLSGSYYLESLTDQIVRKAWASFQQKVYRP
ncbi:methylmalonyl-CoA mutase family protein [Oscillatoria amoena NRMC-F 0135]|nr:methylmalonyl-CoA mutase family protein [Oscillatoria amoena NRMC-F 0135]